jgi:RNA 3'-terminal phosphate cyclase (ATP)
MIPQTSERFITINGALGEGGGQVLRSSLALSLITNKPFTIVNIRKRRAKPGLMAQHLKAVDAAAAVGMARVEGSQLGSQALTFEPSGTRSSNYNFDIGTAGSTSLVLQTILLPLSFACGDSTVTVIGGTHVPWSPCFHYLERHWLHYMQGMGFRIELKLDQAGFYPRGGGCVRAVIHPADKVLPMNLTHRGALKKIRGISAVANLDVSVAERQRIQAIKQLGDLSNYAEIEIMQLRARSKGTFLLLIGEFENSQCCFYGLGALRKRAEGVADEAVSEFLAFLASDGAIDHYLADQLILPMALARGASGIRTSKVTQHLTTNVGIVKMFLPVSIEIDGDIGHPGSIRIRPMQTLE